MRLETSCGRLNKHRTLTPSAQSAQYLCQRISPLFKVPHHSSKVAYGTAKERTVCGSASAIAMYRALHSH